MPYPDPPKKWKFSWQIPKYLLPLGSGNKQLEQTKFPVFSLTGFFLAIFPVFPVAWVPCNEYQNIDNLQLGLLDPHTHGWSHSAQGVEEVTRQLGVSLGAKDHPAVFGQGTAGDELPVTAHLPGPLR